MKLPLTSAEKQATFFTKENNKGSWETEKLENDLCEIRTQLTFSAFNQKGDTIFFETII